MLTLPLFLSLRVIRLGGMNKLLMCTALLGLTACARVEPIDDNALMDVGDLPTPAELANEAEAGSDNSSAPGLRFAWREVDNGVVWGPQGQPADADPRLSMVCIDDDGQPQLLITHFAEGDRETGVGTLRVSGNGTSASLPIAVLEDAGGSDDWTANVDPGNLMDGLANTFAGIGRVNVSLSGAQTLQVEASDEVRAIFNACGANAAPEEEADVAEPEDEAEAAS